MTAFYSNLKSFANFYNVGWGLLISPVILICLSAFIAEMLPFASVSFFVLCFYGICKMIPYVFKKEYWHMELRNPYDVPTAIWICIGIACLVAAMWNSYHIAAFDARLLKNVFHSGPDAIQNALANSMITVWNSIKYLTHRTLFGS